MTYPGTGLADLNLGSKSHSIRFKAPFAKAAPTAKDSAFDGTAQTVRLVNVPGSSTNNKYWQVTAANQANVPGVAVIVDDELGHADMPVYQVNANLAAGATVSYELDNGVTGTSNLPYTAPTGRSIVSATVTSGPVAGPNALPYAHRRHQLHRVLLLPSVFGRPGG